MMSGKGVKEWEELESEREVRVLLLLCALYF